MLSTAQFRLVFALHYQLRHLNKKVMSTFFISRATPLIDLLQGPFEVQRADPSLVNGRLLAHG